MTDTAIIANNGLVLMTVVGSGLHGTAIEGTDDHDEMGICIEPPDYVIGLDRFEQHEFRTQPRGHRSGPGDIDRVVYSLRKWMRLALQGNPTVLLPLFAPPSHVLHITQLGRQLRLHPEMFHSKESGHRFLGYLRAQRERLDGTKAGRHTNRPELEAIHGFDCYADDTEFLTSTGWKTYDEINDGEELATLNPATGSIEFQHFFDRVSRPYSGPMVSVRHRYSDCLVTPNHRMWVSPINRGPSGIHGTSYREIHAAWRFVRADMLQHMVHTYVAGIPQHNEYPIADATLALVGAYVSEGCVGKRLINGAASVVRFDQKAGGRLEPVMAQVGTGYKIREYAYPRAGRDPDDRFHIFTLADRKTALQLDTECGSGSRNKQLPPWTFRLSARQADVLLNALLAGDGTRTARYWIYYTISPKLAGDVQALSIISGRRSNVWGPYQGMYQVMVQDRGRVIEALSARTNIEPINDWNGRIVCFSVPNETLVSRRNGRVAIHGNTKYAMHAIRLGLQGIEFVTTGRITLPVPEPDRTWLVEMRQGKHSLAEAQERIADVERTLHKAVMDSDAPPRGDREAANALLVRAYQDWWARWDTIRHMVTPNA